MLPVLNVRIKITLVALNEFLVNWTSTLHKKVKNIKYP